MLPTSVSGGWRDLGEKRPRVFCFPFKHIQLPKATRSLTTNAGETNPAREYGISFQVVFVHSSAYSVWYKDAQYIFVEPMNGCYNLIDINILSLGDEKMEVQISPFP